MPQPIERSLGHSFILAAVVALVAYPFGGFAEGWEHLPKVKEFEEAGLTLDNLGEAEREASTVVSTIGPVAPPRDSSASDLCENLIASISQAEANAWIRNGGVAKSLPLRPAPGGPRWRYSSRAG